MTADAPSTPPAEIDIDEALIRNLLRDQYPQYAEMPVQIMEAGWDNMMVRLGDDLALRLPRRAAAEPLILNEQRWLPILAPHLPLDIPVPLHIGKPGGGYPFHWSILKWIEGEAADLAPPDDSEATSLANFLRQLHALALPENPPENSVRDCPLSVRQRDTERRMQNLADTGFITPGILAAWQRAVATPLAQMRNWIAGDIHARNVLTRRGKIAAFIDWGDMCAGDAATDLASIWALLDGAEAREAAIKHYGMSDDLLTRSVGWAISFGVILAETGRSDTPRHFAMGRKTLARIDLDLKTGALAKLFA